MSDHVHILIGIKPNCCLSDWVREMKKPSNNFIKERKFTHQKFEWQDGYAAFSHGQRSLDTVIHYIMNQKEHYKKQASGDEYAAFLKKKFRLKTKMNISSNGLDMHRPNHRYYNISTY